MKLDDAALRYLSGQPRGHLATVDADGHPQNKPVGFRYNTELGTIDISGTNMETSAKYRNVRLHPDVAFVVDDVVSQGPDGVHFLEIRGRCEHVTIEPSEPGLSPKIIRIHPRRAISWNVDPDRPGMQTHDLLEPSDGPEPPRPTLASSDAITEEAVDAVTHLIEELQAGWDEHDADLTDRSLADDVVWGSPFGASVRGYDALHAIHVRLKKQGAGGPSSRFEVVEILAPTPDVAIAQVRRLALDADGRPLEPTADTTGPFSETMLYVLVKKHGSWWLAAGQNTPIRPAPG